MSILVVYIVYSECGCLATDPHDCKDMWCCLFSFVEERALGTIQVWSVHRFLVLHLPPRKEMRCVSSPFSKDLSRPICSIFISPSGNWHLNAVGEVLFLGSCLLLWIFGLRQVLKAFWWTAVQRDLRRECKRNFNLYLVSYWISFCSLTEGFAFGDVLFLLVSQIWFEFLTTKLLLLSLSYYYLCTSLSIPNKTNK